MTAYNRDDDFIDLEEPWNRPDATEVTDHSDMREKGAAQPQPVDTRHVCPTCKSKGFTISVLGPDRCTFCDGTEGGLDPRTTEVPVDDAIYGIPEAIGTSEDFPMTSRDEYLGQSRTPPAGTMIPDAMQAQAIQHAIDHLYTNISGTAGVGKTKVAKDIVKLVPGTILAATTGIAAVNLGEGSTINSVLKYFDTADLKQKYLDGKITRMINALRKRGVRRILIDEKSMLGGDQLTYITRAVRQSNEGGVYALEAINEEATETSEGGGRREEPPPLGITLVGDFGQLPPIPDSVETKQPGGGSTFKKLPLLFAFDSPEWALFAEHTTTLTRIYRQDAVDFVAALHAVRAGKIVDALKFFTPERFHPAVDDAFDGTTIVAKNDEVERYNQLRLDRLPGKTMIAQSIRQGQQRPDWKQIPQTLVLKEGALVMLLANRRKFDGPEDGNGRLIYANGDLAHLIGKGDSGEWVARLHRNGRQEIIYPITRENAVILETGRRKAIKAEIKAQMAAEGFRYLDETTDLQDVESDTSYLNVPAKRDEDDDVIYTAKARERQEFQKRLALRITDDGKGKFEIVGQITYMPLRAAYACTVHKTQGLTLDAVQVNIRDPFFKQPGMLFVALSRCRTAEGLRIVGNQAAFVERVRIEPRVQPWL